MMCTSDVKFYLQNIEQTFLYASKFNLAKKEQIAFFSILAPFYLILFNSVKLHFLQNFH